MTGEEISDEWRSGSDRSLRRRRAVIGLSLVNVWCMSLIVLYQTGLLRHLPDPDGARFDSERVVGSPKAFSIFKTPDGALGMASFATTLALAAFGGARRRNPLLSLMLAGKAIADFLAAVSMAYYAVRRIGAYCSICLTATVSALAAATVAIVDAVESTK